MSCSCCRCRCCCWGIGRLPCAADLVGQFEAAIKTHSLWPGHAHNGLEPRLNAASAAFVCLSKTQDAHFYYIPHYVICNFPISQAPKIKLRHGIRPALIVHTHTHRHTETPTHTPTYVRCTFDLQQFYLRISHIATVPAGCKESQILAEVPVEM